MLINELSSMVSSTSRKMDKSTVLKSTISFIKNHNGIMPLKNSSFKCLSVYKNHNKCPLLYICRNCCPIKSPRDSRGVEALFSV